ncbi:MAG: hypothetical protein ACFBRM_12870 [Pikeienuella sp.]
MIRFALAFAFAAAIAQPAAAACSYQGVTYSVGSTICAAGGWLQECTVAGYWKAIGTCNSVEPSLVERVAALSDSEAVALPGKTGCLSPRA